MRNLSQESWKGSQVSSIVSLWHDHLPQRIPLLVILDRRRYYSALLHEWLKALRWSVLVRVYPLSASLLKIRAGLRRCLSSVLLLSLHDSARFSTRLLGQVCQRGRSLWSSH